MKFLQIISHYVPSYSFGGPLRVAHSISKALVNSGHTVTVCTTNLKTENSFLDFPSDEPIVIDGVTIYYCKVNYKKWGFSFSLKSRIEKEIIDVDYVFTHFHYQYASSLGGFISRKYKKPLIVFPHGSLNKHGIKRKKMFLKYIYIKFFELKNFKKSQFLAFNCHEEKKLSLFNYKGRVIYNGISLENFKNLPPKYSFISKYQGLNKKLIYLFLGRLNFKQKGLNMLLPAFKYLSKINDLVHLIIAGPSELGGLKKIKLVIKNLNLEENVTITGELNEFEKVSILNDVDVFVLPSPSEGLSIALLEALYMNIPVVTTNRVGLNNVIKKNNAGIVVDFNLEELSNALVNVSDKSIRKKIIGEGRKIILQNHIWSKIVENLINVLKINRIK